MTNEVNTLTQRVLLGVKLLQLAGTDTKQLPRTSSPHRTGCRLKKFFFLTLALITALRSQSAQVSGRHFANIVHALHKHTASPVDITLRNSRCELILARLGKRKE